MKLKRFNYLNRKRCTGVALMLVIPVVALSAVLSYAVLANVATQNQISVNAELAAQADCLSESGINYAIYQLQQKVTSQNAPAINFSSTIVIGGLRDTVSVTTQSTAMSSTMMTSTVVATGTVARVDGQNLATGTNLTRKVVLTLKIPLVSPSTLSGNGTLPAWGNGGGTLRQTAGASNSMMSLGTPALVPKNIHVTGWAQ